MYISFVSSNDTGEIRTIYLWSDNDEIRLMKQMILLKDLLILS